MSLRDAVFLACVALCMVAHAAILRSALRRPVAADPSLPRPRRGVEILWALLPMAVLALVFTATWDRMRNPPVERATPVMEVAE